MAYHLGMEQHFLVTLGSLLAERRKRPIGSTDRANNSQLIMTLIEENDYALCALLKEAQKIVEGPSQEIDPIVPLMVSEVEVERQRLRCYQQGQNDLMMLIERINGSIHRRGILG